MTSQTQLLYYNSEIIYMQKKLKMVCLNKIYCRCETFYEISLVNLFLNKGLSGKLDNCSNFDVQYVEISKIFICFHAMA